MFGYILILSFSFNFKFIQNLCGTLLLFTSAFNITPRITSDVSTIATAEANNANYRKFNDKQSDNKQSPKNDKN